MRGISPGDVALANTTSDEEPLRRMVTATADWIRDELPRTSVFPAQPEINPLVGIRISGCHGPKSPWK